MELALGFIWPGTEEVFKRFKFNSAATCSLPARGSHALTQNLSDITASDCKSRQIRERESNQLTALRQNSSEMFVTQQWCTQNGGRGAVNLPLAQLKKECTTVHSCLPKYIQRCHLKKSKRVPKCPFGPNANQGALLGT